ncbi:MAG: hypothetical protein U5L96_17060 [Owenweeksia sp.]|nr:hypothetical protein [Owenweeksia sp.]
MDFKIPRHGYYEAGLEFNRLLNLTLAELGLGFYYRVGPYSLPRFEDNFAAKLRLKLLL